MDITDTESSVDALKQTRDVVDQSTLDPEPFGYSGIFIFTEQFLVIYEELIINFILALVAVAVLSLFILGKVGVVALVCFTVVRRLFRMTNPDYKKLPKLNEFDIAGTLGRKYALLLPLILGQSGVLCLSLETHRK